jgi:hypothetical protein
MNNASRTAMKMASAYSRIMLLELLLGTSFSVIECKVISSSKCRKMSSMQMTNNVD